MPVGEGDVLQATWKAQHSSPNTRIVQSFYYRAGTVNDGDDANNGSDLITRLVALYTNIQASLSDRYVMTTVRVTNQTQKVLMIEAAGPGFQGTGGGGEVLPAQDAALVVCRSRNLGHQGRKFLGPLLESVVDNGAIAPGSLAQFEGFGTDWEDQFVGALTANTFDPGTVKFAQGGAVQSFTPFEDGLSTAFNDMRTQRSRRPGVGLG